MEAQASERFLELGSVLRLRVESLGKLVASLFTQVEVAVQRTCVWSLKFETETTPGIVRWPRVVSVKGRRERTISNISKDLLPVPFQENVVSKTERDESRVLMLPQIQIFLAEAIEEFQIDFGRVRTDPQLVLEDHGNRPREAEALSQFILGLELAREVLFP